MSAAGWMERAYRAGMRLYPRGYREQYGDEQASVFLEAWRAGAGSGRLAKLWLALTELSGLAGAAFKLRVKPVRSQGLASEGEINMADADLAVESWFGGWLRRRGSWLLLLAAVVFSMLLRLAGEQSIQWRLPEAQSNWLGLPFFALLHFSLYLLVARVADLPAPAVWVTALLAMLAQSGGDRIGILVGAAAYGHELPAPIVVFQNLVMDMLLRLGVFAAAAFFLRWLIRRSLARLTAGRAVIFGLFVLLMMLVVFSAYALLAVAKHLPPGAHWTAILLANGTLTYIIAYGLCAGLAAWIGPRFPGSAEPVKFDEEIDEGGEMENETLETATRGDRLGKLRGRWLAWALLMAVMILWGMVSAAWTADCYSTSSERVCELRNIPFTAVAWFLVMGLAALAYDLRWRAIAGVSLLFAAARFVSDALAPLLYPFFGVNRPSAGLGLDAGRLLGFLLFAALFMLLAAFLRWLQRGRPRVISARRAATLALLLTALMVGYWAVVLVGASLLNAGSVSSISGSFPARYWLGVAANFAAIFLALLGFSRVARLAARPAGQPGSVGAKKARGQRPAQAA